MWYCRHIPRSPVSPWGVRVRALIAAGPALLLPVLILGGLYQGFMTPAESASVASIYAILLGRLIYRELTWQGFKRSLRATAETTTAIFAIIAMAVYFSIILTYTKTPQSIIAFFVEYNIGPLSFMLLAGLTFLILGTFLEVVPVFYLTVPIFYPLCLAMKIDPLQFYVYMVGLVGLGMLTPPVCVGLYTASAVIREPPSRAFRAVPGFMLVGLVYAGIVLAFPWLSVWLPGFM
jgi:C4-dicarboxylate transporter DctM subunit